MNPTIIQSSSIGTNPSYQSLYGTDQCCIRIYSILKCIFREHHSKVVSTRHYRAPEVIYGLPWNHKIDIWSIACILFEYYTGKTMFQTHDNCEHLAMMDKTIGSPPNSFAKKCKHPFYTRVGTNYVLNWDENTEDGVYVKTNCKPLEVLFELNDFKCKTFSRNIVFG